MASKCFNNYKMKKIKEIKEIANLKQMFCFTILNALLIKLISNQIQFLSLFDF